LIKIGGRMIAYKGPGADGEAQMATVAVRLLGGDRLEIADARIPDRNHKLVLIGKAKSTPGTYPRKAGTPAKNPL